MNPKNEINYTGPFITMVILMGLIGFLTVLNAQFQLPLKAAFLNDAGALKNTLATFVTFSFFLAYLVMGVPGAKLVSKTGYRTTLVTALVILIAGLGLFELSAWYFTANPGSMVAIGAAQVPVSYFIFLLGSFVVGTALTLLQVVVNPYIVACNVKGTSDVQRQTISGAANSTMSTIAPLIVALLFFGTISGDADLSTVEIGKIMVPFAILMVVVAILAFIIKKISLPEIAGIAAEKGEKLDRNIWGFRHLALGVVAIFFYVGVEVAVGANIVLNASDLGGTFAEKASLMATLYFGGMLIGRLCGSFISKISASIQLTVASLLAGLLVLAAMITANPWLLVGLGLFHSIMWPAIFSLAIRGLGKYTTLGSGALMLGVFGGAVLPFCQGIMADVTGNWNLTWIIVLIGEAYLLYYALVGCKIRPQDDMTTK